MSMLEKVRGPRLRPVSATPKERQAWNGFVALVDELHQPDGVVPPIVTAELERLCAKGNPLALRFRELVASAAYAPRTVEQPARDVPPRRRITNLQWGRPSKTAS